MIIDGRKIAKEVLSRLEKEFVKFGKVKIAAFVVGDNPASFSFLKQKRKTAEKLGIEIIICHLPLNIEQERLGEKIKELNNNSAIKAIILQLPLPAGFGLEEITKEISPQKDIDALSSRSLVLAPAVEVVKLIFDKYQVDYRQSKITLVGFGRLTGKPIGEWLSSQAVDFFLVDENSSAEDRENRIKTTDILISGVGKANLVPAAWLKQGVVVIDFGYDFRENRIFGDFEQKGAEKAKLFTPTPKGTGPILVAMLFQNLLKLLDRD